MSFAASFRAIAAQYGQVVTLSREGTVLGTGRAILRPLLDRQRQFVPTQLGLARKELVLCMGEAALPLSPSWEGSVLTRGADTYDVVNVRPIRAGEEVIYWRAILQRRDGEEG